MRTLDHYLLRELCLPFAAGLGLFFTLAAFAQLLRISDTVTGLGVTRGELALAIAYSLPPLLGLLIPVATLFSGLLAIGRLCEDRELLAMMSLGIRPERLLRVPLITSLTLALVTSSVSIFGEPWGVRGLRELLATSAQRALVDGVRPQEFIEWVPNVVFFAAERGADGLKEIFFSDRQTPNREVTMTAQAGRIERGAQFDEILFVLEHGTLILGAVQAEKTRFVSFETARYKLHVGGVVGHKRRALAMSQEMTMSALARAAAHPETSDDKRALFLIVWHRRLALGAACIVFGLLAVPLGMARRGARARAVLISLAIVLGYYYTGRALELSARAGTAPVLFAAWAPNFLGLLAFAFLWGRRRRNLR